MLLLRSSDASLPGGFNNFRLITQRPPDVIWCVTAMLTAGPNLNKYPAEIAIHSFIQKCHILNLPTRQSRSNNPPKSLHRE